MTSGAKASLRYGLLAGSALICAALATLGRFRALPMVAGQVKGVCLVGFAITTAIQGAALFPRSWPSRLIVKPQAMAAGSLILFAGAFLLLVLAFTGCSPAKAKLAAHCQSISFTAANEQFRGACFTLAPLEALKRTCCRDDARVKADPKTVAAVLGLGSLDRRLCGSKPCQRVRAGRINRCRERATNNDVSR
jgi:hypothetical protein